MQKFPMTAAGLVALEEELKHLKAVERPAIIRAIAEARAHGDLSENAEYHAAREQQGFIEGRINELEAKFANAEIIDPKSLPETTGSITKMLFNVRGDCDGFLLDGDQQVHFAPHMSAELLKAVKVGDKVKVHGVKPRSVELIVAASVTAADGKIIIDHGPQPKKH